MSIEVGFEVAKTNTSSSVFLSVCLLVVSQEGCS